MRVSTNPKDPGFVGRDTPAIYRIFLDGEEVLDVITADSDTGEVITYVKLPDGRYEADARTGRFKTQVTKGRVLIVPSAVPVQ
jgi:hypothetical protein